VVQEILANAHETRESLQQFLLANCLTLSSTISSQLTLEVRDAAKNCKKNNETRNFWSSGFFKVIEVDMTKKFVTWACCDRQHIYAYLQRGLPTKVK